jgi:hypothetical protein
MRAIFGSRGGRAAIVASWTAVSGDVTPVAGGIPSFFTEAGASPGIVHRIKARPSRMRPPMKTKVFLESLGRYMQVEDCLKT